MVEVSIGRSVTIKASVRTTPAGLVAAALLATALLATAMILPIIWLPRTRSRSRP